MSRRGHHQSRSERVYEALLSIYPKSFRDAYGPQMVQVFGDLCREERERAGLAGLILLWARTVLDLLRTAASERTRMAFGATFVIPVAGSPRMARWGGAAAIVGAVCSLVATALNVFGLVYLKEPIFNALRAYQDGGSGYSPFIVLLHPNVSTLLSALGLLLIVTAFVGLYAFVSRRSGRMVLFGGVLMCVGFAMLAVFAASNAYRLAVILGGRLGEHGTDPLAIMADLALPATLVGALLLSFAVARTWALGPWSILPLLLMFAGTALHLVLLRLGFPLQDHTQAVRDGAITLLVVHSPTLATNIGWVLLGWIMLRRSGEVPVVQGMTMAIPQSSGTGE